jgi:hypothetical protein
LLSVINPTQVIPTPTGRICLALNTMVVTPEFQREIQLEALRSQNSQQNYMLDTNELKKALRPHRTDALGDKNCIMR